MLIFWASDFACGISEQDSESGMCHPGRKLPCKSVTCSKWKRQGEGKGSRGGCVSDKWSPVLSRVKPAQDKGAVEPGAGDTRKFKPFSRLHFASQGTGWVQSQHSHSVESQAGQG